MPLFDTLSRQHVYFLIIDIVCSCSTASGYDFNDHIIHHPGRPFRAEVLLCILLRYSPSASAAGPLYAPLFPVLFISERPSSSLSTGILHCTQREPEQRYYGDEKPRTSVVVIRWE